MVNSAPIPILQRFRTRVVATVFIALAACHSTPSICADDEIPRHVRARLLTATVRIVRAETPTSRFVGSGAVVGHDSAERALYVLTAWHVINGPGVLSVEAFSLADYPQSSHRFLASSITVFGKHEAADLALLRVKTRLSPPAVLQVCPLDRTPSTPCNAIGSGCSRGEPQPILWSVPIDSAQVVRAPNLQAKCWIASKREPFQGESGGPLVSADGRLIGVCSGGIKEQSLFFYTHLQEIHSLLSKARAPARSFSTTAKAPGEPLRLPPAAPVGSVDAEIESLFRD